MKRIVFGNILYRIDDDTIMLFNLFNYRRKLISNSEAEILCIVEEKASKSIHLSKLEQELLNHLEKEKQILNENIQKKALSILERTAIFEPGKLIAKKVTLNITHNCNFQCSYCYQNMYKHKNKYSLTMSTDKIDAVIDYLKMPCFDEGGIEEVVISGGESKKITQITADTIRCLLYFFVAFSTLSW